MERKKEIEKEVDTLFLLSDQEVVRILSKIVDLIRKETPQK